MAVVLRQKIGSDNTHYVHGLRGIQSQVANSAWTEAMSDVLGSVRGWLDGSQSFVDTMDYNPYGVPDSAMNGFGFTGEITDANELVYLRARYYSPEMGAFNSLDPFEGFDASPMSLNGYSYVEGNPINWADPSGRCVDNMVANAMGQSLNINFCADIWRNLAEGGLCSLYTARYSTVTISTFQLPSAFNVDSIPNIKGIGAIVQYNGKEYLLTSDHFYKDNEDTCSSLSLLQRDSQLLFLNGASGGKAFSTHDFEQSCISDSGYTLLSFKDASKSFGVTPILAGIKAGENLNGVIVGYASIPWSNSDSIRIASIHMTIGGVDWMDIHVEYQPYDSLSFYIGSFVSEGIASHWRMYNGEGTIGDSGNVAFSGQNAVAVFVKQDARLYNDGMVGVNLLEGAVNSLTNILSGNTPTDYPTRDSIYRSIQQYP